MKKLNKNIIVCLLLFYSINCVGQQPNQFSYIDKNKPGLTAQKFAPGFISKESEYEFGSVFSKDGTEFYYAVVINGKEEIRYTKLEKNGWSIPKTIISHHEYGYNDPFLSPDEQELFYISNMPRNESDTNKDIDIWYSKKVNGQWSKPINAGANINSDKNEYYISFTTSGKMYFASNKNATENRNHDFDIYTATRTNGTFDVPKKLSDSINTKHYEADVFIAPDESYMIFSTNRKEGFGRGDLYISFKDNNGAWKIAKNMGTTVNTESHELCPFVTHDGKYFFYTSKQDIYWVSTEIFEKFR